LPTDVLNPDMPVMVEGSPTEKANQVMAATQIINGHYFETMRIPIKQGRNFTGTETQKPEFKIIISETLAKMLFAEKSPIGQRLFIGSSDAQSEEIIGVAGDVSNVVIAGPPVPVIYWPYIRVPFPSMAIVIRTASGDPISVAHAAIAQVYAIDQNQPVSETLTMDEILSNAVSEPKFDSYLLSGFACSAFILAIIGIFGVVSYNINQKTREIGIRIALGATKTGVAAAVVGHDMIIVGIGSIAGVAIAFALTRFLPSVLAGVHSNHIGIIAGVFVILIGAAAAGSYLPVLRATRIDPARALRNE
jgi:putative ABC transport system permease protein